MMSSDNRSLLSDIFIYGIWFFFYFYVLDYVLLMISSRESLTNERWKTRLRQERHDFRSILSTAMNGRTDSRGKLFTTRTCCVETDTKLVDVL